MKTFTQALALVVFSLPLLANAAGKTATASMQVTFEVKESCNVQSSAVATTTATKADSKATPAVACQLNTPYLMARNTAAAPVASNSSTAPSTAIRQETTSGDWTIYF